MQEWNKGKELTMARLEDDESFLMSFVRLQDGGSYFNPLWELYGHDQSLFLTMLDDAEAISFHYFLPLRPSSQINTKKRQMLDSWLNERNTKPRMAASTLSIIQDDWDQFTNHWEAVGGFNWFQSVDDFTEYDHGPFLYGLKVLAREMYERVLQRETQNAIQFMLNLPSKPVELPPQPDPADQVNQMGSETYYLLAAAGSGKTHKTFETLEKEFGFYLVSGAARHQELVSDAGERLYSPRASIVSEDTDLLFRTIEPGWKRRLHIHEGHNDSGSPLIFERRCELLLISRLAFFFEVIRQTDSQVRPWHWLRYQLSCNGNVDPFRKFLRCLIFLGDPDPFKGNHARWQKWESEYKLLWCFDEVQCDNAGVVTSNPGTTILSSLVAGLVVLRGWERGLHRSVLAGTSMNLEVVKGAIARGLTAGVIRHLRPEFWVKVEKKPLPLGGSPLISKNKQFKSILEPSIHSAVEVIWDATSPGLTTSDSMSDCVRRNLGPSLVGDETIFEDYSWITCLHQRRKVQVPMKTPNKEQVPLANPNVDEVPLVNPNMEQNPWAHLSFEQIPWANLNKDEVPSVNPNMEQNPWANLSIEQIPWADFSIEQIPWASLNMDQIPWGSLNIDQIPWGNLNMEQFVQVITKLFLSDKYRPDIEEQSRALRGRCRWSVCFIEELFKTYFLHGELGKELIIQASEDVQARAKEPLKRRLNTLTTSTDPERKILLNDVFQMAMQATLFGRSRILNSRQAEDLIEQAIGYVQEVKEGISRVCLVELLVVNAVMEYRNLVDSTGSLIDGSLAAWQYSASSFGFIAEDRLAEAIYLHTHKS
jgi:hypothetical protein